MDKNIAIIVAGGKGSRMNSSVSKQFIHIKEKPIIAYTLDTFDSHREIDEIILVLPEDELQYYLDNFMNKYPFKKLKTFVTGGTTRQESVFNALSKIDSCSVVLIHDGVRPFVDERMITEGIAYARTYGAAACGVAPKDTIKVKGNDDFSVETLERSKLFAVQTPQCFQFSIIKRAHEAAIERKLTVTDDTSVVEALGERVYLYEGSYDNIKITTPEDILIAEKILEKSKDK